MCHKITYNFLWNCIEKQHIPFIFRACTSKAQVNATFSIDQICYSCNTWSCALHKSVWKQMFNFYVDMFVVDIFILILLVLYWVEMIENDLLWWMSLTGVIFSCSLVKFFSPQIRVWCHQVYNMISLSVSHDIWICHMTSLNMSHDVTECVTWYHWVCHMISLSMSHDITEYFTWYHWACHMISLSMSHDITEFVTWYHWVCHMISLSMSHDINEHVTWYHWVCHMISPNLSHDITEYVTWYH